MKELKLTEQERDLIEAIRNFKKSKHNYSLKHEEYVRDLFEIILLT